MLAASWVKGLSSAVFDSIYISCSRWYRRLWQSNSQASTLSTIQLLGFVRWKHVRPRSHLHSTTVPYIQKSSRQKAHHRGALKDCLLAPNYRPRTRLHAMPCNIGSAETRTSRDPVTLASLRKTTGIAIRVPKRGHIFTDVSKVGHEGDPRAMAVCR